MISAKSWRLIATTEVPSLAGVPGGGGTSVIVLKSKTPEMLNQSASFNGVLGLTYEIPFTAYRTFPFNKVLELANTSVLVIGMVP